MFKVKHPSKGGKIMHILFQTTKSKVDIINAINSQESVKDHLEAEFKLMDIIAYQQDAEDGTKTTVSCFIVSDAEGEKIAISSVSPVVFSGLESVMEVCSTGDGYDFAGMFITFHSGKSKQNRDFCYFTVR